MLTYFLDKQSKIPLYEQLYTQIRDEIHQGILVVNQQMPSKRHLSAHLKVSIQTIETTYDQLVAEGYLRSIPRTGYFVEEALLAPKKESQKTYSLLNQLRSEVTSFQFDLKTNAIDPLLFPSLIWAKMTRLVLSEANTQFWNQTELLGMKELREGISNHLARFRGMNVRPDQIVIGNGSEYLLGLISMMFPQELSIAVENPSYIKISKLYQAYGRKIESIELDQYGLNIKQLRESNASIVHITPSHQFPTGKVMPIKRRLELLQWAHEKPNRFIIEDDYDSEFRFTGQPIPSLHGLEAHHQVIYLNSFSKTLAPALRMGFMVLPVTLMTQFQEQLGFFSCPVPNVEQATLAYFMKKGHFERHLFRMRMAYKFRRDALIHALNQSLISPFIEIQGEDAGLHFLLYVKCNVTGTQLVSLAKTAGIRLQSIQEYAVQKQLIDEPILVIGYADLQEKLITSMVSSLEKVWGPCLGLLEK